MARNALNQRFWTFGEDDNAPVADLVLCPARGNLRFGFGSLVSLGFAGGLFFWLLRSGERRYGAWATFGGLMCALMFGSYLTLPCWFELHRGGDRFYQRRTISHLNSIQAAETRFYSEFHRYGDIREIEERIEPFSQSQAIYLPYTITLLAGQKSYRLLAAPYSHEKGRGCWIGCPRYRYLYGDESGVLRANTHCEPATALSPELTRRGGLVGRLLGRDY